MWTAWHMLINGSLGNLNLYNWVEWYLKFMVTAMQCDKNSKYCIKYQAQKSYTIWKKIQKKILWKTSVYVNEEIYQPERLNNWRFWSKKTYRPSTQQTVICAAPPAPILFYLHLLTAIDVFPTPHISKPRAD